MDTPSSSWTASYDFSTDFADPRTASDWPAGDLAVQAGLAKLLGLAERPSERLTRELAEGWRPHRGAAAIFTWHCYNNPAL